MPNYINVDVIIGPCPGPDGCPVVVTPNNANVCQDATTLTIAGSCFDPIALNNTVTFNLGAIGFVTSATSTSLTVQFTTLPTSTGTFTAVVNNGNGPSNDGVPAQVATIIAACGPGCSFSRIPSGSFNSPGHLVSGGLVSRVYAAAGETLVVKATAVNGDYANAITVRWGVQDLTLDKSAPCTDGSLNGKAMLYSVKTLSTGFQDVEATVPGSTGTILTLQVIRLIGSATNAPDAPASATASGLASAANTGATAATSGPCEIAEALILRLESASSSNSSPTWQNGFIASGHLNSAKSCHASEAWKLVPAAATVDAAISETAAGWGAVVQVYK